jgi:carboxypeptidase C (cathepsin A)
MDISARLRENIQVKYYEAGHMMYIHPPSRERFSKDLADFIGD